MKDYLSPNEVEYWSTLVEGQQVEVHDGNGVTLARGTVDTPAPDLGIAWIRTESGERKLVDMHENLLRPA